jgi:hypothetical protein
MENSMIEEPGAICPVCNGTGEEQSGVCHCGMPMEGHSAYDNHLPVEMVRRCEECGGGAKRQRGLDAEDNMPAFDNDSEEDVRF